MGLLTAAGFPDSSPGGRSWMGAELDGGGAASSWSPDTALHHLNVKWSTGAKPRRQPELPSPARMINPTSNQKSRGSPLLKDPGGGGGLGF